MITQQQATIYLSRLDECVTVVGAVCSPSGKIEIQCKTWNGKIILVSPEVLENQFEAYPIPF
jgi:hypothetical protein